MDKTLTKIEKGVTFYSKSPLDDKTIAMRVMTDLLAVKDKHFKDNRRLIYPSELYELIRVSTSMLEIYNKLGLSVSDIVEINNSLHKDSNL